MHFSEKKLGHLYLIYREKIPLIFHIYIHGKFKEMLLQRILMENIIIARVFFSSKRDFSDISFFILKNYK